MLHKNQFKSLSRDFQECLMENMSPAAVCFSLAALVLLKHVGIFGQDNSKGMFIHILECLIVRVIPLEYIQYGYVAVKEYSKQ